MRKDILERKKARLEERRTALKTKALASTDASEVRSINDQIEELNAELTDIDDELRSLEPASTSAPVNGQIVSSTKTPNVREDEDRLSSMEYRKAFRAYVCNGTPIPANLRGDANTTVDTGAAIPMTIINDVINTVRKRYGNLYAKVRKTAVTGGVEYPVGALQATFSWINESTVSPRKKTAPLSKVIFNYHPLELRLAQSFLSSLVTLSAFEARITEVIAVAYLQAMDDGIVNGSGNGCMLGLLNDTRVPVGNTVDMTGVELNDWTAWRKKFFSQLPLGYRFGEFIFSMATVDSYLETMADSNNNPVYRQATGLEVNDGDAVNPNGRFFGREISIVEPDIIPDFDTASEGDVIGIYWTPSDYMINENFGFTMRRYFDEETNEWVDKALAVADGKLVNPNGVWYIKKDE